MVLSRVVHALAVSPLLSGAAASSSGEPAGVWIAQPPRFPVEQATAGGPLPRDRPRPTVDTVLRAGLSNLEGGVLTCTPETADA